MNDVMKIYMYIYPASLILAAGITPILIRLACRLNVVDGLSARKIHSRPVPRIGGAAIYLSTVISVILVMIFGWTGQLQQDVKIRLIALLAAGTFIFLVGLTDDLRGLRAKYKLLAQIAAAAALTAVGVRIEKIDVLNLFTVDFGWLSYPITVFWIVAVTNAVNLIDGLDGLAGGISVIACATIAVFAFYHQQLVMCVLMFALLGGLTGFLFFNFSPARIFMGDCGSMFLGFILASSSVMCAVKSGTMVAIALPAIALGLPMFDTFFSMLRRYLGRWGIMSPDRSHLHHRLLDMGLKHRHVVITMYLITVLIAGLGMFMMVARSGGAVLIFASEIILLVLVFRAAGAVRLREVISKLKYHKSIQKEKEKDIGVFEDTHLRVRKSVSFSRWWRAISDAAEKEGFLELSLQLTSNSGKRHKFIWKSADNGNGRREEITLRLPMGRRRFNMPVDIEATIAVNGLLESVGRRIMLFGRLIDEYSIAEPLVIAEDIPAAEFTADNRHIDVFSPAAVSDKMLVSVDI